MLQEQEAALLDDDKVLIHIKDITVPMPDNEALWSAQDSAEWSQAFENHYNLPYHYCGSRTRPVSANEAYNQFLEGNQKLQEQDCTSLHVSLLLHPLQAMVHEYVKLASLLPIAGSGRRSSPSFRSAALIRVREDSIQSLLQRWLDVWRRCTKGSEWKKDPIWNAALVKYYLICLSTLISFPEAEDYAQSGFPKSKEHGIWLHQRVAADVRTCIFQCGQILRLFRNMQETHKPLWAAAAIYRIALILAVIEEPWQHGSTRQEDGNERVLAIDQVLPEHQTVAQFLDHGAFEPVMTDGGGSQVYLRDRIGVLSSCLHLVVSLPVARTTRNYRKRLEELVQQISQAPTT